MESVKKVEATRAERMATEPRRLTADEKDALLKEFHPDYNPDAFAQIKVGPNKGQKAPLELAEMLHSTSRLLHEKIDLTKIDYDVDVLVIGGGDGGVARELSHYEEIEVIDVVEPDEMFVEVCKEYFPDNSKGLEDKRVNIYYQDGLRFLRTSHNEYDLIMNDATDPFGHTEGLFTKEFYGSCYKALKDDGIMVYQHGSPFYDEDEGACKAMHKRVYNSFPISRVYQAHIPTCAAGYWLFGFASKKYHPLKDLDAKRWNKRGIKTWYYTTNLHRGAFMLPKYVEDLLAEEEK